MAALRGGVQGSRGEATRLGHQTIEAWVNDWNGYVEVQLWKDGDFIVQFRRMYGGNKRLYSGNTGDLSQEIERIETEARSPEPPQPDPDAPYLAA